MFIQFQKTTQSLLSILSTNLLAIDGISICLIVSGIICFIIILIAIFTKQKSIPPQQTDNVQQDKVITQQNSNANNQYNYEYPYPEQTKNHSFLKILLILAVIAVIFFGAFKVVDCANNPENTDGAGKLTSRSARYSDVSITQSDEFTLTTKFILVPQTDIDNLEVTIHFSDSSQRIIKSKTKTIGNVVRNGQYTFSFNYNEFSLQETLNIEYWRYEVTGGTVSYFS